MSYIIGSGYTGREEFAPIWIANLEKYANPKPDRVVVIAANGKMFPGGTVETINLSGNLGHVGDLLDGRKPYTFCGWSVTVLTLALIAYQNESDLIFVEEDCLVFGDWVTKIHEEIGDGKFIFGHKQESEPWMECSQSLFMIRHGFIPTFVTEYLLLGPDNHIGLDYNPDLLPERKFVTIESAYPDECRRLSFGVDRCRPIPFDNPVFYAQRWTPDELQAAREKGLI